MDESKEFDQDSGYLNYSVLGTTFEVENRY